MESERRRPRTLGLLSATVSLMLTYGVTPSQCFQSVQGLSVAEPRVATRRFFRDSVDASATSTVDADSLFRQNPLVNHPAALSSPPPPLPSSEPSPPQLTTTTNKNPKKNVLPTWLAQAKDTLWESNWHTLEESMLESFFTPQETQRLLHTIETAARGDRQQMANAAEFCLILVETMEMGLTALMASAHHVCACVTAREQQILQQEQQPHSASFSSPSSVLRHYHHFGEDPSSSSSDESIHTFDHVAMIAKDAGRLKSLEMVAARIYSDKSASRVTPDSRDAKNLRSLLLTETKDWRALAIRSAAALFRLRGILNHASQKRGTSAFSTFYYPQVELTAEALQCSREALYIYAPLASRLGMHRLKNELEGAAFRILYRRQYEKVNRLARELRPRHSRPHLNRGLVEMCDNSLDISSCMKNVLETVKTDLSRLLREDAHFSEYVQDFSVTARVKEPYSLWKKMLRNKCQHIMEVPDAIALRIVLDAKRVEGEANEVKRARERALCYYAQTLCMEHWQPNQSDPRYKDYIESPKRNGYQSLHYTAHTQWDSEDWNLEIQVRTGEMHQVAEFGLASHWDYKAQQNKNTYNNNNGKAAEDRKRPPEVTISALADEQSNDAYLRSVQEWHWHHHAGKAQAGAPATVVRWMMDDFEKPTTTTTASSAPEQQQQHSTATFEPTEARADRIRARTKKLLPYIEALTAAQSDLAREHVFVFLTSEEDDDTSSSSSDKQQPGRVLALPAGACVLDALREGQRELGFAFPDQVRLNGEVSSKVTSKLQNGDILTVAVRRGLSNTAAMA